MQPSLSESRPLAHPRSSGYGFPTTFGFVIASILGVISIQLLVLRDRTFGKRVAGSTDGSA
jgi:hypothetical protein